MKTNKSTKRRWLWLSAVLLATALLLLRDGAPLANAQPAWDRCVMDCEDECQDAVRRARAKYRTCEANCDGDSSCISDCASARDDAIEDAGSARRECKSGCEGEDDWYPEYDPGT